MDEAAKQKTIDDFERCTRAFARHMVGAQFEDDTPLVVVLCFVLAALTLRPLLTQDIESEGEIDDALADLHGGIDTAWCKLLKAYLVEHERQPQ